MLGSKLRGGSPLSLRISKDQIALKTHPRARVAAGLRDTIIAIGRMSSEHARDSGEPTKIAQQMMSWVSLHYCIADAKGRGGQQGMSDDAGLFPMHAM
jgi:hypothetical protein